MSDGIRRNEEGRYEDRPRITTGMNDKRKTMSNNRKKRILIRENELDRKLGRNKEHLGMENFCPSMANISFKEKKKYVIIKYVLI